MRCIKHIQTVKHIPNNQIQISFILGYTTKATMTYFARLYNNNEKNLKNI